MEENKKKRLLAPAIIIAAAVTQLFLLYVFSMSSVANALLNVLSLAPYVLLAVYAFFFHKEGKCAVLVPIAFCVFAGFRFIGICTNFANVSEGDSFILMNLVSLFLTSLPIILSAAGTAVGGFLIPKCGTRLFKIFGFILCGIWAMQPISTLTNYLSVIDDGFGRTASASFASLIAGALLNGVFEYALIVGVFLFILLFKENNRPVPVILDVEEDE